MKVTHVITGLDTGGAEIMLLRLLGALRDSGIEFEVISLSAPGAVGERIGALGIPVHSLDWRASGVPRGAARLVAHLRASRPDVVQTWMYHADLAGGVAAKLAGVPRVCWCLQNSTLDTERSRAMTRRVVRVCGWLSRWLPDRIVSVSEAGCAVHEALGYDRAKMLVIPNGIDTTVYRPDPAARADVRREFNLSEDAVVIGMVGRYDPQKDHATFLRAAGRLLDRHPFTRFLLCGHRVDWDNAELVAQIDAAGPRDAFRLLGVRTDTPRIQASLDIMTLSSAYGEAFSLAVGEAMACEVPCVVTDVGDGRRLVGDTGRVVPPRDPAALAAAWEALLALPQEALHALGRAARARVDARFTLSHAAALYRQVWEGDQVALA